MIKIFIVSIIMLYEYGLKTSVSTLQKRNYVPKKLKPLPIWRFNNGYSRAPARAQRSTMGKKIW